MIGEYRDMHRKYIDLVYPIEIRYFSYPFSLIYFGGVRGEDSDIK